mmetsp:Transcript_40974/g.126719  ORF Transcript_40974/g.126719 Transcript_40974/m.126719 type:complete len:213 (-) Transcript_40974:46-684(-)
MLFGRLVVSKLQLDAGDLPDAGVHLPLALAHRVGRVVVVAIEVAPLRTRLQVLTGLLVHLADGKVQLRPGDADDLDQHFLVALHPVGRAGHHAGLLCQLAQVAQAFLSALCSLHRNEATVLHDTRNLRLVGPVELHRRRLLQVIGLLALLGAAAAAPPAAALPAPAPPPAAAAPGAVAVPAPSAAAPAALVVGPVLLLLGALALGLLGRLVL